MNWDATMGVGTVVSVILATFAVYLAFGANRTASKALTTDSLIRLEELVAKHDQIYFALRPGGKWSDGIQMAAGAEEWAPLEDYMGFFELLNILLDEGTLPKHYVESTFRYRYENIVHYDWIRQHKLVDERSDWVQFINLGRKLGVTVDEGGSLHYSE